jgi:hypothetical protein
MENGKFRVPAAFTYEKQFLQSIMYEAVLEPMTLIDISAGVS